MDDIVALAREMHGLKAKIDGLNAEKKALQARYDELRNVLLPETMHNRDIPRITVREVGSLHLFPMVSARMADKDRGMDWLREHDYGDIITETVPHQSLTALVKEQIKEGRDFPPDIFAINMWEQARIRNS